jgi:hypothetical protein
VTNTAPQADSRGLQYLEITDFSPGIFDNSVIAGTTALATPGLFPAPPGAADVAQTFGCTVLQNGGLGPLPALAGSPGPNGLSLSDIGIATVGTTDISALINSGQNSNDELIIGATDNVGGGSQRTRFWSYVVGGASLNAIGSAGGTFNFSANNKNFVAYPFTTTLNTVNGICPVVVLALAAPAGPTSQLMNYPPQAAQNTFSVDTITNHPLGSTFGHQGRIVTTQPNTGYSWPAGIFPFVPNEGFSFTDPSQSQTWPQQFEIFGPENPFGYGALSSVSAGELFCIKRRGGAIIIQGDLNNPTVTSLPAVQSTGEHYGRAASDQIGMYYCAEEQGAWVWNGGNSSSKISNQLDDFFYRSTPAISDTTYYGYYVQRWGQWMLFSNNWVYYAPTNSWWRLENPQTRSYFWYVPGWSNVWMFAAVASVPNTTTKWLFEYNLTIPRASYSWQNLPLHLSRGDRTSEVREVVISAANAYGDAAPVIAISLVDDKGNVTALDTWTMRTGTNTIQTTRLNAGVKQTTTVAMRISASGTTAAPVVHRIGVGFRTREHLALT